VEPCNYDYTCCYKQGAPAEQLLKYISKLCMV
jgi:hypothetical protein